MYLTSEMNRNFLKTRKSAEFTEWTDNLAE
jgi:hypothetical protein